VGLGVDRTAGSPRLCERLSVQGSGCRSGGWGVWFELWCLGFTVWVWRFGVWGLGFEVWGLRFGMWGLGTRV